MYLIQFRLQFFLLTFTFIQEIMFIKATRLQAWAPAVGGSKSRPSPPSKKSSLAILGAFWLLFLYMGPFLLRFSHFWGPFHHVGAFFLLFTSWWGPFLGRAPPPTKISAGSHDCKEGSRACSPEIFCVTTI